MTKVFGVDALCREVEKCMWVEIIGLLARCEVSVMDLPEVVKDGNIVGWQCIIKDCFVFFFNFFLSLEKDKNIKDKFNKIIDKTFNIFLYWDNKDRSIPKNHYFLPFTKLYTHRKTYYYYFYRPKSNSPPFPIQPTSSLSFSLASPYTRTAQHRFHGPARVVVSSVIRAALKFM